MKLADGITVLEAESFESEMEIFVITEDEQKYQFQLVNTKWKTDVF